jgi:TolA-binding protein
MKDPACARAWQAEAVEDGRLSGADRASFARHAATCEVCAREVRALARLRQAAERLPVRASTPLERRRLRNDLLRRANGLAVRTSPALRSRSLAAALAAMAVLAAFVLWLRAPTPAPASLPAPDVPTFQITASDGAEWRTVERSASLRLSVRRGRFELEVDKLRAGQRFLLDLPDGEVEVQGTRFVVEVDGLQTRSVRVIEGRVALRLRERGPLVLGAGEGWPAEAAAVPAPAASSAASALGAGGAAPAAKAPASGPPRAGRVEPAPALAEGSELSDRATPSDRASAAGVDFALAMSTFSAGDYGRAEQLFIGFERDHPGDARVEDATFLRAVARARRGDSSGAQALAREYLRRYPRGLRRIEAERLAQ